MSEIKIEMVDGLVLDELLDSYDLLAYVNESEDRPAIRSRKHEMRTKIENNPNEVVELLNVYEEIVLALNDTKVESDVIEKKNNIKLIVGAAPWQLLVRDINAMHLVICNCLGVDDMHEVKLKVS